MEEHTLIFFHFFTFFALFFLLRNNFFSKKPTNGLIFFEFGTISLLRVARNLMSPMLSRLEVSHDPEIENKATITGLGLVAEMNLVELGLVAAEDESGGTRTSGGYMLQVDSNWRDGGGYAVAYMDSDWW